MKEILLPTDGSENARKAIRYAVTLFGNDPKYLIVNSWMMPHAGASMLVSLDKELSKDSAELLEREVAWFKEEFPMAANVDTSSEKGDVVHVLSILVNKPDDQMVVMGTKGASGIEEVLIGSNTAAVVGKLSCPVIAVPSDAELKTPVQICLAADYREIDDNVVWEPLVNMVKSTGAELSILHVKEDWEAVDAEEYAESLKLRDYFSDLQPKFVGATNSDVTEGINEYADRVNADMIVVLSRNEGFFHRLFNRSESKKLAMHTKLPLVVLHEK